MPKKSIIITLGIIALIAVLGVTTYIVQQRQDKRTKKVEQKEQIATSPEKPEIDTSDWKTYRHEKYGFEFKYPKEYEEVEECKLKETDNGIELGDGRFGIEVEVFKYEHPLEYHVFKFIAEKMQEYGILGLSLDELAKRNIWIPWERVLINNNEGFRVELPSSRPIILFFLSKGNKLYKISWSAQGVAGCLGYAQVAGYSELEIFEQIPFTFKLY